MGWLDGVFISGRYWRYDTDDGELQEQEGEYYVHVGYYSGHDTVQEAYEAHQACLKAAQQNKTDDQSGSASNHSVKQYLGIYAESAELADISNLLDFSGDYSKYIEARDEGGCCYSLSVLWLAGIKTGADPLTGFISAKKVGELQLSDHRMDWNELPFEVCHKAKFTNFQKALEKMFSDYTYVATSFEKPKDKDDAGHCIGIYKLPGAQGYLIFDTCGYSICWVSGADGYQAHHNSTRWFVNGVSEIYLEYASS